MAYILPKDIYLKRLESVNTMFEASGCVNGVKLFTSNIYYLNRQYNTGTFKINTWLKANGYTFVLSRTMISYLHSGKRNQLNFMYIYIYTMYYNSVFNLKLQPYELITFNFELHNMYINPNRKKDLRYNKVKRIT